MKKMNRSQYIVSDDCKVVTILGAYRRLFKLDGVDFVATVNKHRKFHTEIGFLEKVDTGFEVLDDYEIISYLKYIAEAVGYIATEFYTKIYYEASRITFSYNDVTNNKAIIGVIANIDRFFTYKL